VPVPRRFLRDYRSDGRQQRRIERILAFGRAFFAISGLVAIYFDPTNPTRFAALTYALLLGYAAYSVGVLLWIRRRPVPAWMPYWLHGTDISFAAAITFFSEGPVSPFFLFFLFTVLAAAYRWGFAETLVTALVTASIHLLETAVAVFGPWQQSVFAGIQFDGLTTTLQITYLLLTGALLGYLGDQEKQMRAEMAATTDTMKQPRVSLGLGGSLSATAQLLLRIFESRAIDVVIQDHENARTMLWQLTPAPPQASGRVPTHRTEMNAGMQAAWLFNTPFAAWFASRPDDRPTVQVSGLDASDAWSAEVVTLTLDPLLADAREFRTVAGVDFGLSGEWRGRILLYDPAHLDEGSGRLQFLASLAEHLTPVVSNVFLLRRLRSRASAAERARVARELHDGAIQALIGIEMETEAARRLAEREAPATLEALAHIQQLLRREVVSLRELMQELRPPDLDEPHHLPDLLAALVERFRRDSAIAAHFSSSTNTAAMPLRTAVEVARITQEALTNVRKHSRANRVLVELQSVGAAWQLSIDDNGTGFPFEGRLGAAELKHRWLGPAMLMERARLIGGKVNIVSTPGKGARVEVTFSSDGPR
jgi:signal transduction histidine kinase